MDSIAELGTIVLVAKIDEVNSTGNGSRLYSEPILTLGRTPVVVTTKKPEKVAESFLKFVVHMSKVRIHGK